MRLPPEFDRCANRTPPLSARLAEAHIIPAPPGPGEGFSAWAFIFEWGASE